LKETIKKGNKVLIPRTGGGKSLGTVTWVESGMARVDFPTGVNLRGLPAPTDLISGTAHKIVPVSQLELVN